MELLQPLQALLLDRQMELELLLSLMIHTVLQQMEAIFTWQITEIIQYEKLLSPPLKCLHLQEPQDQVDLWMEPVVMLNLINQLV